MKLFNLVYIVFVIAWAVLTVGCGLSTEDDVPPQLRPALTVNMISTEVSQWPVEVEANGHVEAWQESIIGSEIGGVRLANLYAEVGDRVEEGQLLAELNIESLGIAKAQAEAELMGAEARNKLAQKRAERVLRLKASGALSDDEGMAAQSEADLAEAELKAAKARLNARRLDIENASIRSPDSGIISSRSATVGTVVSSGSELFRLIRKSRFEWRAQVPFGEVSLVLVGQPVKVRLEDGSMLEGTVRKISPSVSDQSLSTLIYVDLPKGDSLRAGAPAAGIIEVGREQSVHVPESALVYRDGYNYLASVGPDNRVHLVRAEVGRRRGGRVEIKNFLEADREFVAEGGQFLYEGDLVRVEESLAISYAEDN